MSREIHLTRARVTLFLLAIAASASAKTIYVDAHSPGGGGTHWTDAYTYLQDALADAELAAEPVEIRVAQGIYRPDEGSGVTKGVRTETFQLINGVTLKGGYAGAGEADPDARDVDLYETILSGDLDDNDVVAATPSDLLTEPTRAENSYHVVTGHDTDATAVLDGFTITAGNADSDDWDEGGGVYCFKGSPTFLHCDFVDNSARSGGGMAIDQGVPTVIDCEFVGNSARGGGGIIIGENNDPNLILTDCTFINNTARSDGGGINTSSTITLMNCTFFGNQSMFGSGGGSMFRAKGTITELTDNKPTLIHCTFINNFARIDGGGMCANVVTPRLVNCTFAGNHAEYSGGGMFFFMFEFQIPSVTNCILTGNTAGEGGGGFYSTHDNTQFSNCTITNNHAGGDGGGYSLDRHIGTPAFNNCIFWGNTADGEGPQISIKTVGRTVVTVHNSNVQGGKLDVCIGNAINTTLAWDDAKNIDMDPLFVDADGADNIVGTEDDNLRLLMDSPCIDTGDNSAVPVGIEDDLNGFPRFIDGLCSVDTGNGTAPIVDMGAYEFLRSDIDSDGDVDLGDFSQFSLYWGNIDCGDCRGADLTCDGDVDGDDLKELADNWLK
jgi:predicted outer membrane repeat protein